MPQPGASLLSYRASIPLSNHTLIRLAKLIRTPGGRTRLPVAAVSSGPAGATGPGHLLNGDTHARLIDGFAIGTTTAWRYVRETVELVGVLADDVHAATARAARLAYAILDGTLIPIDRLADERLYYRGKQNSTGRTCGCRPIQRADWCGPRQRFRAPSTTSPPHGRPA